jgi:type I restriction enzyme S subunit
MDMVKEFNDRIVSIYDKILLNQGQIHTLEKLRDTLLPKLMSGEVRVKY